VCAEWDTAVGGFDRFLAHIGPRPDGRELDRINNVRGYEPGNVRWATRSANASNRRSNRILTMGDESGTITEWSRRTGISVALLGYRLRSGWSTADALRVPAMEGVRRVAKSRARNRSSNRRLMIDGVTHCVSEWSEIGGVKLDTICHRLDRGWDAREAVFARIVPSDQSRTWRSRARRGRGRAGRRVRACGGRRRTRGSGCDAR